MKKAEIFLLYNEIAEKIENSLPFFDYETVDGRRPPLYITNLGTKTLGQFHCSYYSEVRLNEKFAENFSKKDIENALLHELAHAIAGVRAAHGKEWQNICRKLERIFPDQILERARPITLGEKALLIGEEYYEIFCPHCNEVVAIRKNACKITKFTEKYKHSTCKTTLQSRKVHTS